MWRQINGSLVLHRNKRSSKLKGTIFKVWICKNMRFTTILILFGCLLQNTFASRFGRNAFLNFHNNAKSDQKRSTASQKILQPRYLREKYLETTLLAKKAGVQRHFADHYFRNYYQTKIRN